MLLPMPSGYGLPVDSIQVCQVTPLFEVVRSGIGQSECPSSAGSICPFHHLTKVGFQVNDLRLAAPVREFHMIGSIDHV